MAKYYILAYFFTVISMGWSSVLGEEMEPTVDLKREPRSLQAKLCLIGLCGGHQGGYGGYQGGYGNHQGGYNQGGYYPYPPINIGISQSQSSSSAGGGGYGSSSYPNNYQYNGGYPHSGYHGSHGYNRPGYFGNGFGAHNNQFNGNYNGGSGYGFQRPFGYSDESSNGDDYDDGYNRLAKNQD